MAATIETIRHKVHGLAWEIISSVHSNSGLGFFFTITAYGCVATIFPARLT